jgi:hypothetical protein
MNELQAAIEALELLAAGKPVPRTSALIAASQGDRDLRDAAAGLRTVANGGTLDLDEGGRARAAALAATVRRCHQSSAPT